MMVQRQQEKWPFKEGRKRFTSKTNMRQMRSILLNPAYGFTKQVPGRATTPTQIVMQRGDATPEGGPQPVSPRPDDENPVGTELDHDAAVPQGENDLSGQAMGRSDSEDCMTLQVSRSCLFTEETQ
jgi:hypothetical protein